MRLSKIDLSKIVAVGHADGYLGLLIDRGEEVEYIEIPAPNAAYQGLQQVNSRFSTRNRRTSASPTACYAACQLIDGKSNRIRSH